MAKYKVGDIIGNWEIIDFISGSIQPYVCKCLKCGNVVKKTASSIQTTSSCNKCSQSEKGNRQRRYKVGDIINGWEIVDFLVGSEYPYVCKCLKCGNITNRSAYTLTNKVGCKACQQEKYNKNPKLRPGAFKKGQSFAKPAKIYKVGDIINGWEIVDFVERKSTNGNILYQVKCPVCGNIYLKSIYKCKSSVMCISCSSKISGIRLQSIRDHIDYDKASDTQLKTIAPQSNKKTGLPRNVFQFSKAGGFYIKVLAKGVVYKSKRYEYPPTVEDVIKFKRNLDIDI